jgi:hypothetical protein
MKNKNTMLKEDNTPYAGILKLALLKYVGQIQKYLFTKDVGDVTAGACDSNTRGLQTKINLASSYNRTFKNSNNFHFCYTASTMPLPGLRADLLHRMEKGHQSDHMEYLFLLYAQHPRDFSHRLRGHRGIQDKRKQPLQQRHLLRTQIGR